MSALGVHWQEAIAVAAGLVYVVLILRRNRWGWVAGALSSSIYIVIAARARLPMQSLLQMYYVGMSAYGWYSWKHNAEQEEGRIFRWRLRSHPPPATRRRRRSRSRPRPRRHRAAPWRSVRFTCRAT